MVKFSYICNMNYVEVLKRAALTDANVVNLYQYGSRCYGNFREGQSDWDFIAVVKTKPNEQFSDNLINVSFFTVAEFERRLQDHEISALECYYLPTQYIWKQTHVFTHRMNLAALRHALSAKSSNSFVKSKKKLAESVDFDPLIGKKSLFHAFRIIRFGIQLATSGSITDYSACNDLYNEIMFSYGDDWQVLFTRYKQAYNQLLTEFRLVAPK